MERRPYSGVTSYFGIVEQFPMLSFATFSLFLEAYRYQLEWRRLSVIYCIALQRTLMLLDRCLQVMGVYHRYDKD